MIIVVFLVCIVCVIIGVLAWDFDEVSFAAMVFGIFGGIVSLITAMALVISLSGLKVIDTKIDMYQTENALIESQIAECVEQYQKYETEIYTEVKAESAITLVALYPELKADQLVSKQIEVYLANNEKIKDLKVQKINGDVWRWWLYFGKGGEGNE